MARGFMPAWAAPATPISKGWSQKHEGEIGRGADDDGQSVVAKARRRRRPAVLGRHIPALDADARSNRPDEDGAEEKDRAEIAVREEMRERPDLHAGQHRMLEPRLDASRQIGRGDADEGEPDQQEREVARPDRRIPDRDVAAGAVLAVADGDQNDARPGTPGSTGPCRRPPRPVRSAPPGSPAPC